MVQDPALRGRAELEMYLGEHRWLLRPGESVTIGRDPGCAVQVADEQVSRRHATVALAGEGWVFTDHSTNGSFRHGERVSTVLITDPVVVRLGDPVRGVPVTMSPSTVTATDDPRSAHRTHARVSGVHELRTDRRSIGRATDNDVVIDDVLVSRHHAELDRTPLGWRIRDLGSANGTFVEGQRVTDAPVGDGDLIGIGHALFELAGDQLVQYVDQGDVDVSAHELLVTRDGRRLLDEVSFHLPGRSLTAVLGPSGSGKSTLLGALTGARPADSGQVSYGGRDLYADYAELRQRIGVVPQDDILHPQLTVARAMSHAARLRFPPDVPAAEREQRIGEVLEELGLTGHAHQRIDSLSGGQRKRTSVALELLTRPSLLFLDEPTSGLDPGLDKQVMRTLRTRADAGRTVVVITHNVANLDLCDRLIVLATGGRVAYAGPPAAALDYFGVTDFADVFLALQDETVDWTERLARSGIDAPLPDRPPTRSRPAPEARPRSSRARLALVQYRVLCRRTYDVVVADRTYLVFLAALPVLLSGLAHAIPSPQGLSTAAHDPGATTLLLVIIMSGGLMGTAGSVREFVKERTVYQRERAIGLSRPAYLGSKLTVLGLLSILQAAVFTALALVGRPGPDDPVLVPSGSLEIGLAVIAVCCTSMVLGLLISTAISNADRGMPLLVMAVMVQLVLSGSLFALMGRVVLEQVSWLVPFRWAYAMASVTTDVRQVPGVANDPLWRHSLTTWGLDALALAGLTAALVFLVVLALRRQDPPRRRPAARAASSERGEPAP
jgi:ABC transport system ATP-binding/permease protein